MMRNLRRLDNSSAPSTAGSQMEERVPSQVFLVSASTPERTAAAPCPSSLVFSATILRRSPSLLCPTCLACFPQVRNTKMDQLRVRCQAALGAEFNEVYKYLRHVRQSYGYGVRPLERLVRCSARLLRLGPLNMQNNLLFSSGRMTRS